MSGTRPDPSKLYHRKMPATWWLKKKSYFLFMLRELSSVFIAFFLVVYLCPDLSVDQRTRRLHRLHAKTQFAGMDSFPRGGSAIRRCTTALRGFNRQPLSYPYGSENVWSPARSVRRCTSAPGSWYHWLS